MRICVLQPSLDSFKGGNHLSLFGALKTIDFTIVCRRAKLDGALPPNVKVITLEGQGGSYYYGFADARFASAVLRTYPVTDAFWTQFDCIHLNQTLGVRLLELQNTGKPLLYAVHHPVTADLEVACEESSGLRTLFWKLRYSRLVRWQKRLCTEMPHILTVSKTVADRLVRDYECSRKRIYIVPNGVDTEEFSPPENALQFDAIAVGSFLHPRKGFQYLLEAYKALAADGRTIADVGRRSTEQKAALEKIPQVTTFGTVPHEKLVSLMRGSSVLLSTSLYEGFGLSLIEALACGHPCIAFGGGAVPEVLDPIDPSLHVPVRDTQALVARLHAFLHESPNNREKAGAQYRAKVLQLYSLRQSAAVLEGVYRNIGGLSP